MWVFIKFFLIDNMNWTMCDQFKEENKVYILISAHDLGMLELKMLFWKLIDEDDLFFI